MHNVHGACCWPCLAGGFQPCQAIHTCPEPPPWPQVQDSEAGDEGVLEHCPVSGATRKELVGSVLFS